MERFHLGKNSRNMGEQGQERPFRREVTFRAIAAETACAANCT